MKKHMAKNICFVKNETQFFLLGWCDDRFSIICDAHNLKNKLKKNKYVVVFLSSQSSSFLSKRIDWNCLTLANDGVKSQNFNDSF